MLKDFLQGKPIGHPLHPLLVHFPIGLFGLSLVLDLAAYLLGGSPELVRGSYYCLLAGVITALLAAVPGVVDWWDIRKDHPARLTATFHMILNLVAVTFFASSWWMRTDELSASRVGLGEFLVSLAGIGIISYSGYLGGILVYDDGIGVGRHRRLTRTPRETLPVAAADTSGSLVPVAEVGQLGDGETLRIEVADNVLTLACHNGSYFAFQEFCTHRYGPLSEGPISPDGHIECPWHRSCFAVRTGQVIRGPAKVDLKSFEVMVEGRQILVRFP